MTKLVEKKLSREEIYDGRIIHVYQDDIELPNGNKAKREVVHHPGGVAILALDENLEFFLVRQFRYPYQKVLREVPAGKLDAKEEPAVAVRRELREETGAEVGDLYYLGEFYPSPGFCDEILHLYFGWVTSVREAEPDEDEFLAVQKISLKKAVEEVLDNKFEDGKTVALILKVWYLYQNGKLPQI